MSPKNVLPYESDLEYLDAEAEYLQAKAELIGIKERLDELNSMESQVHEKKTIGIIERVQKENLLHLMEQSNMKALEIRAIIDERLSQTRMAYGDNYLGIQALECIHKLNGEQRLILTLLLIGSISGNMLSKIIQPANLFQTMVVEEILNLICQPDSLQGWIEARDLLPPLVNAGLISIDYMTDKHWPECILTANLHLTRKAWNCLTGLNEDACGHIENQHIG